jgi:hypothetical protein
MPRATVDLTPKREELKSAPPDGYIMVVPLPYGKILERRDNATKMSMEQQADQNAGPSKIDIGMLQRQTRMYEFEHCITDHNLEDHLSRKLDLKNPRDFDLLDPKIGQEIEVVLDKLNQIEEEVASSDSFTGPASQDSTEETERSTTMSAVK